MLIMGKPAFTSKGHFPSKPVFTLSISLAIPPRSFEEFSQGTGCWGDEKKESLGSPAQFRSHSSQWVNRTKQEAMKTRYRKQKSDYRTPPWVMSQIRAVYSQAIQGYAPPPENASQSTTGGPK